MFFESLFLSWKTSVIRSDYVRYRKLFFINKVHYFDLSVSYLYTFNPLSFSLKKVMTRLQQHTEIWRVGSSAKLPTS